MIKGRRKRHCHSGWRGTRDKPRRRVKKLQWTLDGYLGSNPLSLRFCNVSSGLVAAPSAQRRSCSSVTVCVVAGCLTWISIVVPGATGSTHPACLNTLMPTIAASYRLSPDTSTLCRTPESPMMLTVQAFVGILVTRRISSSLNIRHAPKCHDANRRPCATKINKG